MLIKLYSSNEFVPSCCQNDVKDQEQASSQNLLVLWYPTTICGQWILKFCEVFKVSSPGSETEQSSVSSCHLTNNRLNKNFVKLISAVKE